MTIDLPEEDHRRLKALAAISGTTMRELVVEWIHDNLYGERSPNRETLQAIKDADEGRNLIRAKDAEDLFRKLGI
jgi:hypothetical protein